MIECGRHFFLPARDIFDDQKKTKCVIQKTKHNKNDVVQEYGVFKCSHNFSNRQEKVEKSMVWKDMKKNKTP